LTDRISKQFTFAIISIAAIATIFWLFYDPSKAFNVFTAVLIVACPCAIALAAPFTMGNLIRIFGVHKYYLKNTSIIEKMASVDTVVFDKTGTLTTHRKSTISYEGMVLSEEEKLLLTSTLRASNHPLSRALYDFLDKSNIQTLDEFEEEIGQGISASINDTRIKIGAYSYVNEHSQDPENNAVSTENKTAVHVSTNTNYKGSFVFHNEYREGVADVIRTLKSANEIIVLSGDNDGEKEYLIDMLPEGVTLYFNKKPEDKLAYIKQLQNDGKNVMMVGDGLNDAGALAQSNVGVVISEDVNVFSPASDGIMDASMFQKLPTFFELSKGGVSIIKWSLLVSLAYNLIGLAFAVTGHLKPVIAAILMPLSSISIVIFTTAMTQLLAKKLHAKNKF
jgi:Cu+-exporting ATPase